MPPQSFLYLSLMHFLSSLCMYAVHDIQSKGILIFDLVAPSDSAGHSSDLPVCSALLSNAPLTHCRSPFPSVFLHQR